MAEEAFDNMELSEIRLEVFNHNVRAIAAYARVGFEVTGEHVEWVPRRKTELRVIEMRLTRDAFLANEDGDVDGLRRKNRAARIREARQRLREERQETRAKQRAERASRQGRIGTDGDIAEMKLAAEPVGPD